MNKFIYADKKENAALKINKGYQFTKNSTLKYHDINGIVELILQLKEQITKKRNKQLEIMKEHLKGSLYSYAPFHFTMYNGEDYNIQLNEEGFFFDICEKKLYVDVEISPEILVQVRRNYYSSSDYYAIILYFMESEELKYSKDRQDKNFPYTIKFYIDEEKTKLFSSIDGLIQYKYSHN